MFLLTCECWCSVSSLPCCVVGWSVIVAFPGLRPVYCTRSSCKYQVMYNIKILSSCCFKIIKKQNDFKICGLEPNVQVTLFTKCKSIWLHYSPFHTKTFYNFCQFLNTFTKFPSYCPLPKLLKLVFSTEKRDPEGGMGWLDPTEKSHVAIGFLRNTSTDPLEGGSNCFSREVCMVLCEET